MRRSIPILLVGAVVAFATACSESAIAPTRLDNEVSTSSGATSARGRDIGTTELATFDISPNGGTYRFGAFELVVPAGAVCDPSTTKYGVRHWNEDCTPLARNLTVKVVATARRNGVSVDFQPDLRFRPSAGWVTIQTSAYRDLLTSGDSRSLSANSNVFRAFAMLYVPSGGGSRIDEVRSTGDRSLITHIDRNTGLIWRRIKHFSGYTVFLGYNCVGAEDGTTCSVEGGGGLGGLPDSPASPFVVAADSTFDWLSLPEVVVDETVEVAADPS